MVHNSKSKWKRVSCSCGNILYAIIWEPSRIHWQERETYTRQRSCDVSFLKDARKYHGMNGRRFIITALLDLATVQVSETIHWMQCSVANLPKSWLSIMTPGIMTHVIHPWPEPEWRLIIWNHQADWPLYASITCKLWQELAIFCDISDPHSRGSPQTEPTGVILVSFAHFASSDFNVWLGPWPQTDQVSLGSIWLDSTWTSDEM